MTEPGDTAPQSGESESKDGSTVLIVDDNASVRSVVTIMLETAGYRVLAAPDGPSAIDIFRENGNDIEAVLLDVTMPEMTGDVVLERLRDMDEGVRVILTTGWDEQQTLARLPDAQPSAFLKKPFRPDNLVDAIRRVVDDAQA